MKKDHNETCCLRHYHHNTYRPKAPFTPNAWRRVASRRVNTRRSRRVDNLHWHLTAPLIRSRLWRFINLFTYLLTYTRRSASMRPHLAIICILLDARLRASTLPKIKQIWFRLRRVRCELWTITIFTLVWSDTDAIKSEYSYHQETLLPSCWGEIANQLCVTICRRLWQKYNQFAKNTVHFISLT